MNELTALQWLLKEWPILESQIPKRLIDQAFEIEKKQIIIAFYEGIEQESNQHGAMYLDKTEAEQYYKETYE